MGVHVKHLFNEAKCLIGFHQYGEWKFDSKKPRGKLAENCIQNGVCERCGKRGERIMHVKSKWEYRSASECVQSRYCRRCGIELSDKIKHEKFEWGYLDLKQKGEFARSCVQVGICRRCGTRARNRTIHRWKIKRWDGTHCSRCGKWRSQDAGHYGYPF